VVRDLLAMFNCRWPRTWSPTRAAARCARGA